MQAHCNGKGSFLPVAGLRKKVFVVSFCDYSKLIEMTLYAGLGEEKTVSE